MSKKNKSAKNNPTNVKLDETTSLEKNESEINEGENLEQVVQAEQQSEQTENKPKKAGKEKVVEVKAKDVAKNNKKKDKNKKPNKMAKALKDTGNELKRITWPPFKQVVKQTCVVLVFVIVFTVVLFGFDQLCIWLTSFLY